MPLSKQTRANRANAQKSTGPKTDQGRLIAAQNAVTHGLHATTTVINSPHYKESPEDYNLLLGSLIWELEPDGIMQHHLVHKIANCLWRYKRVIRAETGSLQDMLDLNCGRSFQRFNDRPDLDTDEGRAAYQAELDHRRENEINRNQIPHGSDAVLMMKYEMRLDRQLTRAYALLKSLKREAQAAADRERRRESVRNPQKKQNEPISS